jgi:YVTN family beta-propeller protein
MRRTIALLAPLALAAAGPPPTNVIPGPDGGGWDYARIDPIAGRLYVARAASVSAFDLSGRTPPRSLGSIAHGHAVLPIPDSRDILVTSGGDDSVRVIDADDGREVSRIPVGGDPDAAVIDPGTNRAYVMNARDGTVSVLDLTRREVVATVRLKPGLEFGVVAGGALYVNNEDANEIETIDTRRLAAEAPIPLPGCEGPSGLAYDARTNRLLSACANGKAAVVDVARKRLSSLLDIDRGPDAVILDEVRRRAYVPCGGTGDVVVVALDGNAGPTVVRRVPTESLARTGALDPRDGSIYLPTARLGLPAHGARRGAPLPGSFHIVVVRRPA